jgi:hypothetical protein
MTRHTGDVRLTVWVEGWQHECCGKPFGIGSTVSWTLAEPEREYIDPLFRPELAVEIDREEDRHGMLVDFDAPETVGTVTAIRAVRVRYARDPDDERVLYPVPGSAELTDLDRSNGVELRSRDFAGYLVEIVSSGRDQNAATGDPID